MCYGICKHRDGRCVTSHWGTIDAKKRRSFTAKGMNLKYVISDILAFLGISTSMLENIKRLDCYDLLLEVIQSNIVIGTKYHFQLSTAAWWCGICQTSPHGFVNGWSFYLPLVVWNNIVTRLWIIFYWSSCYFSWCALSVTEVMSCPRCFIQ